MSKFYKSIKDPSRVLLYVDMWPGDLVHERKLAGIRRYAEMRGWTVMILGSEESRPNRLVAKLQRIVPYACIVESSHGHRDLPPGLFCGVPTVYLDCPKNLYGGRIPRIIHDGTATVREAFRELSSNHPDAYAVVGHAFPYFWSLQRIRDFKALVRQEEKKCIVFSCSQELSDSERAKRMFDWVSKLPRKCAVFAVNDEVALEVVEACRKSGRLIPTDMTLVGVDNREHLCEYSSPTISSVQVDFERAGYCAAKFLDERMKTGGGKVETFGPLMVVRRESTRGFGRREPRMLAAIDLIRREACNGLRARDVAKLFTGTRRLVDIRFREAFGHSILDEIQSVRFEKVFFLLAKTNVAVSTIAGQCGFSSEITLREQFRNRTGMSMTAWRQMNARR